LIDFTELAMTQNVTQPTKGVFDQNHPHGALTFRPARVSDLDLIVRQRRDMFADNGHPEALLEPMVVAFRAWLAPRLAAGAYFGWIVEDVAGEPVAGLGMMAIDWGPHPLHPRQDKRGYITNVYVKPQLRGVGVARRLMTLATEEGRRRGLDLMVLHASAMGRPLYEQLGWVAGSEMMLPLAS
jgi:ribosomal protein S18 acetylase RimI-like enzyme